MTHIPQAAPYGSKLRISPDSVWPLRGPDGLTFAERKARNTQHTQENKQ